jgi:hypothetical protein
MIHQLLDEMIGTPPPSTVDVRGIVRHERRRPMVRLSAAAAVMVVIAGSWLAVDSRSSREPAAPTRVTADNVSFRLVTDSRESGDATAKRLGVALDEAVHQQGLAVRWLVPIRPSDVVRFVPGNSAQNQQRFAGSGDVTLGGRTGQLTLTIVSDYDPCPAGSPKEKACGSHGGSPTRQLLSCAGMPAGCVEGVTPTGAKLLTSATSVRPPAAGPVPFATALARVQLPDRRVLELTSSNLRAGRGPVKASPQQQEPVLTLRQLTAAAVDLAGRITA